MLEVDTTNKGRNRQSVGRTGRHIDGQTDRVRTDRLAEISSGTVIDQVPDICYATPRDFAQSGRRGGYLRLNKAASQTGRPAGTRTIAVLLIDHQPARLARKSPTRFRLSTVQSPSSTARALSNQIRRFRRRRRRENLYYRYWRAWSTVCVRRHTGIT